MIIIDRRSRPHDFDPCTRQVFQFDDWKEEAQKSKDMEDLVQRLLDAPGDADAADAALSPAGGTTQPASPEPPRAIRIWAHALVSLRTVRRAM